MYMNSVLFAGAAALDTHMRVQESIAFNVANLNTPGFKRRVNGVQNDPGSFQSIFDRTRSQIALPHPKTSIDFTQGDLKPTSNPLDVALDGKGFFKVRTADGIRYTRNGSFQIDSSGQITTTSGDAVLLKDSSGQVSPGKGPLNVDRNGVVSQGDAKIGKLDIVTFEKLGQLVPENGGLYRAEDLQEIPSDAAVVQGSLESANVNPIEEFIGMISVGRNFDSVSRLLRSVDDMLRKNLER